MNTPKWATDLIRYVDSMPYGEITIPKIVRAGNKTVEIQSFATETLRFKDNEQALKAIQVLLENITDPEFTGRISFSVGVKGGNIREIGYHSEKHTKYGS